MDLSAQKLFETGIIDDIVFYQNQFLLFKANNKNHKWIRVSKKHIRDLLFQRIGKKNINMVRELANMTKTNYPPP